MHAILANLNDCAVPFLTHEGPKVYTTCPSRHYYTTAREML